MNSHQWLIEDAAELGKDGVESLAAQLRNVYAADYRAIADELDRNKELSAFERQQMTEKLRQIETEFEGYLATLNEIRTAYESLPATDGDTRGDMTSAIELAQASLRLRKLHEELQAAAADRLFA